eukprot:3312493-Rhodomonas_salina.4
MMRPQALPDIAGKDIRRNSRAGRKGEVSGVGRELRRTGRSRGGGRGRRLGLRKGGEGGVDTGRGGRGAREGGERKGK